MAEEFVEAAGGSQLATNFFARSVVVSAALVDSMVAGASVSALSILCWFRFLPRVLAWPRGFAGSRVRRKGHAQCVGFQNTRIAACFDSAVTLPVAFMS